MNPKFAKIMLIIALIAIFTSFQNCQRSVFQEHEENNEQEVFARPSEVSLFPKSPFFSQRTMPAMIESENDSLTNSYFRVIPKSGLPVRRSLIDGSWPLQPEPELYFDLAQYNAFYWANKTKNFLFEQSGSILFKNQITIETNSDKSGWSSSQSTLFLQKDVDLDSGILVYFLGQAILSSSQSVYSFADFEADSLHIDCGPGGTIYKKDCCSSKFGCSKAILSGASDFLVGLIFHENPTLGEYVTQRSSGLGFCNISRSLNSNFQLTLQSAYDACYLPTSNSLVRGQIHLMGAWYASVWWRVRSLLANDQERMKLNQLFVSHFNLILPHDNFKTIFEKILIEDRNNFQGVFSSYFNATVGIQLNN